MIGKGLFVFYETRCVGKLSVDQKQNWIFQYDSDWIRPDSLSFPLSIRLPLQEAAFEEDISKPFFTNLLPEGNVRTQIAKKYKSSEKNDFKLLEILGGECAGAISLYPNKNSFLKKTNYRELTIIELKKWIDQIPRRPLLLGDEKARLSLAGVQEKIPIYYKNKKIYLCEKGAASSHIIKTPIQHLKDTVQNEAYCRFLASCFGLSVPFAEIIDCQGIPIYLVKRYDRKEVAWKKSLMRLHQEDFCQALGKFPYQKYQNEGGPSFVDCFQLAEKLAFPALIKKQLIEWSVFNFLIGNCDAHAKNISILYPYPFEPELAPFYDLMSTTVYEDLSQNMAMKIGGEYKHQKIFKRHWEKFAEEIGVGSGIVIKILNEMAEELPEFAKKQAEGFSKLYGGEETLSKIVLEIEKNAKRVL